MVNISKWYNHLLNWQVETVCKSLFWHQYLQVEWIGELSSEKSDCRNQTGYEEYSWLIGCHNQSTPNKENNAGGLQNWETVRWMHDTLFTGFQCLRIYTSQTFARKFYTMYMWSLLQQLHPPMQHIFIEIITCSDV